jgi:glycosyltransferase involved in cell wall biosynthesis
MRWPVDEAYEPCSGLRHGAPTGGGTESRRCPSPVRVCFVVATIVRLLFVHEVNWQRKVVYEMHDFPELLSLRGHDVVFIDYPEDEPRVGRRRGLDLRTEIAGDRSRAHEGSRVEVRTPGRVLPPPADRLVASVTHVPAVWSALRRERYEAVVVYSVPTNGWQTVWMARRCGVPVMFRAIDVAHALRDTPFGSLIRRAERYVYRNADWISANNTALRSYCISLGARPERVSVEYPGLDLERFSPKPRRPDLCRRYGLMPTHRTVIFMGTFYRFAGLDWLLREFAPTMRARSELRLVLIGGGEAEADLKALVRALGIEDQVIFTGVIDYGDLVDHLRLGDVAVNPFRSELVTDCALPGKVLQYLGCGVPAVCTPLKGLMGMLREGEGLVYRSAGSGFVDEVVELLDDDRRRGNLGLAGRRAMERRFNWQHCVTEFEHAIGHAIRSARSAG